MMNDNEGVVKKNSNEPEQHGDGTTPEETDQYANGISSEEVEPHGDGVSDVPKKIENEVENSVEPVEISVQSVDTSVEPVQTSIRLLATFAEPVESSLQLAETFVEPVQITVQLVDGSVEPVDISVQLVETPVETSVDSSIFESQLANAHKMNADNEHDVNQKLRPVEQNHLNCKGIGSTKFDPQANVTEGIRQLDSNTLESEKLPVYSGATCASSTAVVHPKNSESEASVKSDLVPSTIFQAGPAAVINTAFDLCQIKTIQRSRILICGLGRLGASVLEDLIGLGFKMFTLLDSKILTLDDINDSTVLTNPLQVGENRAAATANTASYLSDGLRICYDTSSLTTKSADFFVGFDMVIITEEPLLSELLRINIICHARSVKFISADIWGTFGYCFVDHEHIKLAERIYIPGEIAPHCHIVKFPTFSRVLDYATTRGWMAGSGCGPALLKVLCLFFKIYHRRPNCEADIALLKKIQDNSYRELLVPTNFFSKSVGSTSKDVSKTITDIIRTLALDGILNQINKRGNLFFIHPQSGAVQNEKIFVSDIVVRDHTSNN